MSATQYGYFTDHYYFSKYLKDKFQIDFLCIDSNKTKIAEENVNVIYIENKNKVKRLLQFIVTAIRLTYRNNYNVMLSGYCKLCCFIGIFTNVRLKILDIRSGNLHDNSIIRRYKNLLIKFTTYCFDKVTVLSESLGKLIKLQSKKTYVVPLGADVIDGAPKVYDRLNLVYVGTLTNRKIEITIEALHLYLEKYIDVNVHYDIIGFGKTEDEHIINKAIQTYNLNGIVQFQGWKNHSELKPYFQKATVGVCFVPQTSYYDVQPVTKFYEYALSGLIIIATNTSENKICITEDNGVLCDDNPQSFYEALEKVYNSLPNYNGQRIRSSLYNYNWENITNNILLPLLNSAK